MSNKSFDMDAIKERLKKKVSPVVEVDTEDEGSSGGDDQSTDSDCWSELLDAIHTNDATKLKAAFKECQKDTN